MTREWWSSTISLLLPSSSVTKPAQGARPPLFIRRTSSSCALTRQAGRNGNQRTSSASEPANDPFALNSMMGNGSVHRGQRMLPASVIPLVSTAKTLASSNDRTATFSLFQQTLGDERKLVKTRVYY